MTETDNLAAAEQNAFIDYFKARWSGASMEEALSAAGARKVSAGDAAMRDINVDWAGHPLTIYLSTRFSGDNIEEATGAARAAIAEKQPDDLDRQYPWLRYADRYPEFLEASVGMFQAQTEALQAQAEALQGEIDELQSEVEALDCTREEHS